MTTTLYPPRNITLPVTVFMDGVPFALCVAEKASLSALHLRLSSWAVYPSQVTAVEFARKTEWGNEHHRLSVHIDHMEGDLARARFLDATPEALAALRQLLYEDELRLSTAQS